MTHTHDNGYRLISQAFANGINRNISYNRQDKLRTQDAVTGIPELSLD